MKLLAIAVLISFAAVLLAGCTQQQSSPTPTQVGVTVGPTSTATIQPTATTQPTASPQGSLKEFTMTARTWAFEPSEIRVNKGDRVKLTITSVDVAHGFAIPEFNVNARLEPGQQTTVEFTADKAGTFSFFCSVVCGSGHSGMRGTLVVEG